MSGGSTPIDQLPITSSEESTVDVRNMDARSTPINEIQHDENLRQQPMSEYPVGSHPGSYPVSADQLHPSQMQMYGNMMNYQQQDQGNSMYSMVMREAKDPLMVAGASFLAHMNFMNGIIEKYVPGSFGIEGELTVMGMAVKALIAGLLFYLFRRFFR